MRKVIREPNGAGIFRPGQDLVIAGAVGKGGVRAALIHHEADLARQFSPFYVEKIRQAAATPLNLPPEKLAALGVTEWENVTEGGIFAALWNLSGAYGFGFFVELLKIPVAQELIEVCERFDLNPYRLLSGDCMILTTDHGADLVRALCLEGMMAAVVGKVEKGIARKIITAAGTGYLERPQPDEVEKIPGYLKTK